MSKTIQRAIYQDRRVNVLGFARAHQSLNFGSQGTIEHAGGAFRIGTAKDAPKVIGGLARSNRQQRILNEIETINEQIAYKVNYFSRRQRKQR